MARKVGHQARLEYEAFRKRTQEEAHGYRVLEQEVDEAITAVQAEREGLGKELAAVYLNEMTEPALMSAERRTGFRGFTKRSPIQALPRERETLGRNAAAIEADPRYQRREQEVGPMGGLTRKLEEARSMGEPWEREAGRFEALAGFMELLEAKYDTPEFTDRWWQPAYWRHWATGDRICEELGMSDFGDDVLPAYLAARKPRDEWREQAAGFERQIAEVHDLVRRHDELVWRRDNLEQIYLEECQGVLARHLQSADPQLLATWAEEDRGVLILLKRLAGLQAKSDVLVDMRDRWVRTTSSALEGNAHKFALKAEKLARPKKAVMLVDVPDGVPEKLAAHVVRRDKARALVRRVREFDAYDRYSFNQPPETWYLHFSGNRRPSAFTPQYSSWYGRHPDVVVITDPAWEDDRVDLSAGPELVDTGDIS